MTFLNALNSQVLILDAAMGTEISSRGFSTKLPLWSAQALLNNPDLIHTIHQNHLQAGAELLTTNTFRTQSYVLGKKNLSERSHEITHQAVALAKKSIEMSHKKAWILGSMAPLEDCYQPDLTPSWTVCLREHRHHAQSLTSSGVDGLILETFSHPREIRAVYQAARETGLPIILSLACNTKGNTLAGEHLKDFIPYFEHEYGAPDVWGLNCLTPHEITHVHRTLTKSTNKPTAVWAHVGHADENVWHESGLIGPKEYAREANKWLQDGARIIGGCCGTDSRFIKELAKIKA